MANTLVAYSNNNGPAHYFNISNEDGVEVASQIAATFAGGVTRKYTVDVPGGLPAGYYTFSMHRDSNDALRAVGDFYWDGIDIVVTEEIELTSTEIQAAAAAAITAANLPDATALTAVGTQVAAVQATANLIDTKVDTILTNQTAQGTAIATIITNQGTQAASLAAIQTAIGNLAIPTAAVIATAVEAALLDDGDGTAFRAGLAATIEAALANEADGNATVAIFQGAVTAALTAYNAATETDIDDAEAVILTQVNAGNLAQATSAEAQSIQTVVDAIQLSGATSTGQATILTDIATAIANQGALLTAVNNGNTAQATAAGQATTQAAIASLAGSGASSAQITVLQGLIQGLIDDCDSDWEQSPTAITKFLQGTTTVLKTINLTGVPATNPTVTGVHA